jgi:hypothetical protein
MAPVAERTAWKDLPDRLRAALQDKTGEVHQADTISSGLNAAFTARLHTDSGVVFAKGVHTARAAAQRREVAINPHVQPIAPRLLWHIDTDGWHVLGFEFLDARPADLSPKSTDLLSVAGVLGQLTELDPPPIECKRIEQRWADAAQHAGADADLLAGDHLLHTDLNPHNLLVTDAGVRIGDWSWPTLGAAWIDTACAALWLIAEGHTPADAERWASRIPVWPDTTSRALDAFTAINAALWGQIAAAEPRRWKQSLHHAATTWAEHRNSRASPSARPDSRH